ncbi:FHA domain-containing protein [Desulforamulus hydrothermalis]|uniref:FHA domain containing protein n=1 Tax=Desulforamulus hydrothermalis Lam5 = DSM 18033 TaxID=1121428 RepID=K8DXE7_9FIRM|nr:FHA domain-containing protein [Desulforamulus hydrothermalis]CCO07180.1 FHA domain containing protein [Desulforamulus hydrothermalis Lam5 = DSM 18033]SHG88373.1 FHA domain-containing protein [Desulforamulus hydrothermalis Lam5 = DSM 18033]
MLSLAITVLRTIFLILLYLFIFRLTVSMFDRLRENARENRQPVERVPSCPAVCGGDGAVLQVVTSADQEIRPGDTYPLGDVTRLGRGAGNHIIFSGPHASHEHARIFYQQGQYWLEDLGSLNSTYLNEMPLTKPTVLANGDRIRIGEVIFRFVRWAYEMESNY